MILYHSFPSKAIRRRILPYYEHVGVINIVNTHCSVILDDEPPKAIGNPLKHYQRILRIPYIKRSAAGIAGCRARTATTAAGSGKTAPVNRP